MSTERAPIRAPEHGSPGAVAPDPRIAAIATWLGQFMRTLKTCRLYDSKNPTVIKFREDLGTQMVALLEARGPFKLEFTAHRVSCDGNLVMSGQSREDDLAMPFYRDGLRTLTFNAGVEPRELNVVLDLLLRVTSRTSSGTEDLVTLLWDADLPHLDISYISSETDTNLDDDDSDLEPGAPAPDRGELMPWPNSYGGDGYSVSNPSDASGGSGAGGGDGGPGGAAAPEAAGTESKAQLRSEDWLAGEPALELENAYQALDATSAEDVDGFMTSLLHDRGMRLITATMALTRDAMRSDLVEGDLEDLADVMLRALHESVAAADWAGARDAVDALTECTEGKWDAATLVEAMSQPDSPDTAALVRHLDEHSLAEINEFVEFARSLGSPAIEWLMGIVAIANHQRTRRTLVRALSELCEGNPERLAPWLGDSRWYVVRNAVMVVASTEGGAPVALFRPLLRHPEARVRQEVVAALANADLETARPFLLQMIRDPEPAIRNAAVYPLGAQRNRQASLALLELVLEADFRKRPSDEVRSITTALGGCAGDEALPHLEEQLYAPSWFSKNAGPYCQTIARCIARIGTPAAMAVLEHGARSRIPATRDACKLVLKGAGHA